MRNHHAWDPGHALALGAALRRLGSGSVVFGVPLAPYKCPPAPYEVALLAADLVKGLGRSGRVKITLVDANANPQPPPKARMFKEGLDKVGVEHVPNNRLVRVDPENQVVETDEGKKFKFDLLSALPRNFAPRFVRETGLARQYTEVDLPTFSTKAFDDVYAIGDHITGAVYQICICGEYPGAETCRGRRRVAGPRVKADDEGAQHLLELRQQKRALRN